MTVSVPRSYLFVPANRPEMFDKACRAGAHAVIVDLEDAVPFADKASARAALAAWLSPEHPVVIRINGADTEWFADDLALCASPGVSGVVLSKAEQVGDIARLREAGAAAILPLIESAAGFDNLRAIAQAPGVARLLFGSIDFQLDLGIRGEREELLYFRSQLVLVSRLAGLQAPVDGVSTAIGDPARLALDTLHARQMGFGGKLCIHPKQVGEVNRAFSPGEEELAWARRVLAAAEASGGAAVAVDGKMVDRPVILRAQQIVDESGEP
ncbi:MAG: CoA ester lyase [Telluria sp.]